MNQDKNPVSGRVTILGLAAGAVLVLYLLRLVHLQLINGEQYLARASNTTEYSYSISAARGDIVDRYGRRITTNVTCYDLVINQLLLGEADLNQTLQKLVLILQQGGEDWNDTLLVSAPDEAGRYTFTDDPADSRDAKALAAVKENLELQQYATADNVMAAIVEKFGLQGYDAQWQRILGGIRYQMYSEAFSRVNTFTLASDISDKTMAIVRENSLNIPGCEIEETSTRSNPDGTLMPHLVGTVGKILAEDWKVTDQNGNTEYPLKALGYQMNDLIGRSGLESVYELELRGTDGKKVVTVDQDGNIVDSDIAVAPQPGLTVMTTIDADLQRDVYKALERQILNLQQTGGTGSGREANAGAVVVIDVKTGGILAAVNYPTYDINQFSTHYSELNADPGLPLYNRCLMGLYTPGSTFKPCVGIAGLLSGTIGLDERVNCTGTYHYYTGYSPRCSTVNSHRGLTNLYTAIMRSCNIFFYDVGRRTTSDVYNSYAQMLGMGVRTGVETEATVGRGLTEYTGRLTTKNDTNYTSSLEIQAAIGQGNTVITPVQLATYAATLANHGTRYKTHMVQALLDTNTGEVVQSFDPVVEVQIEDNMGAFEAVEQGMVGASKTVGALINYPYTIACKTGSPQRNETYAVGGGRKHYTNSMMIAYGPVEDPEIAIGVVIEYGGGGSKAGPIVADVFDAYFFAQSDTLADAEAGVLLE